MVQYKMTYFHSNGVPLRALCEPVRLLMHYIEQDYEMTLIGFPDEWLNEYQKKQPYQKLPVFEIDGEKLCQSYAFSRFLAEKFGLAGKDEWEKAKINEIADFARDVWYELAPWLYVVGDIRPGDKAEVKKNHFDPAVERIFGKFASVLKQTGTGFMVTKGPSWADFFIADYLYTVSLHEPKVVNEKYPELGKYIERVYSLPQVKDYVKSRPLINF
ncbi:putative glutathione S-transferase 5 [Ditylenchus destructor]|nr:putative glutathione S-transferase 5 [Ditylenchus destructor]